MFPVVAVARDDFYSSDHEFLRSRAALDVRWRLVAEAEGRRGSRPAERGSSRPFVNGEVDVVGAADGRDSRGERPESAVHATRSGSARAGRDHRRAQSASRFSPRRDQTQGSAHRQPRRSGLELRGHWTAAHAAIRDRLEATEAQD